MGKNSVKGVPDYRIPCVYQQFFRKRLFDPTVTSIQCLAFGQEANLRRFCWLSQHREVEYHQHT